MKRTLLTSFTCLFVLFASVAQDETAEKKAKPSYLDKGQISLGMRTTTSVFGHDPAFGLGVGGQARVQLFKFMNTEWFSDWITIDLKGAGTRNNAHIGWSVLFYPKQEGWFTPYFVAGHCFDYAKVIPLSTPWLDRSNDVVERWSSAVQAGLGTHFFLNERFNFSFQAQYMLHLGKHLDYELIETPTGYYLETNHGHEVGAALEGHILLTASLNVRLADLW